MQITEFEKEKQIKTMLYTVKILAILFSVIPIFQKLDDGETLSSLIENSKITVIVVSMVVLSAILIFLAVITHIVNKNSKMFTIYETILFVILFLTAILISGKNESYYKFLFIFLIVCSTIQFSLKVGVSTAIISSFVIFAIDYIFTEGNGANIYIENDIALASMFITVAYIIGLYSQLQKQHIEFLKFYANNDGLTKIFNHRYFYEQIEHECVKAKKDGTTVSLLVIDIDYFKVYNDIYGHQKGDAVLCRIVEIIEGFLDKTYTVCRYGGEEFTIILPNVDLYGASEFAEKLRAAVENFPFPGQEALPNKTLTVSIGVAEYDKTSDFNDLVKRADSALYRAKHLKRNCVEAFSNIIEQYYLKDLNDADGS